MTTMRELLLEIKEDQARGFARLESALDHKVDRTELESVIERLHDVASSMWHVIDPSHESLHVDVQDGEPTVIKLRGELDLASGESLQARIQSIDSKMLVVDLRGLEFMDSTGLSVLMRAHKSLQDQGRRLVLVRGSGQVERLMSMTATDNIFSLIDTLEETAL